MSEIAGILSKGIKVEYCAQGPTGAYVEVKNLTSVPALGGTVEKVDVTTLDKGAYVYIEGLQTYDDLDFGMIYDKTQYQSLYGALGPTGTPAVKPTKHWKVTFPDKVEFHFDGQANLKTEGADVNGALTATLTVTPSTEITPDFTNVQ